MNKQSLAVVLLVVAIVLSVATVFLISGVDFGLTTQQTTNYNVYGGDIGGGAVSLTVEPTPGSSG